ncbi:IS4 family transposase [Flavobacterium sp. ZS1P70]|uniref:IS4 family transposase n=1 Tax=Flavobacterium zhoui TaxID=3230414 RepID=A0ABW6I1S6_9FLAO
MINFKAVSDVNFLNFLKIEGLTDEKILTLAFNVRFSKRKPKKIFPQILLKILCLESVNGTPSYNDLASRMETLSGFFTSKQSIWKRVNEQCVHFFQSVLLVILTSKVQSHENQLRDNFGFKRILVQDSTILKIPFRLFNIFSGVSNATTTVCNTRIQAVYDYVSGNFIAFSIDPYSKNDLTSAPELEVKKGDLILRDRGYYTNAEIKRHIDAEVDCIYRFKHRSVFLNITDKKEIDLAKLLKKKNSIDMEVCLNDNKSHTVVRIVAEPVSAEIANTRRMNAKKNARKSIPSQNYLALMGWSIYITTLPKEKADYERIMNLYSLRWRIETIFKSWKSNMNFSKIQNVSEKQLCVLLSARLIMIVLCTQYLYQSYCSRIYKNHGRDLSLIKFIKYICKNIEKLIPLIAALQNKDDIRCEMEEILAKYCSYDKKKRCNFNQRFNSLFP